MVPVLVPVDCESALEVISNQEVRRAAGIREDNQYLFANKGRFAVVCFYTHLVVRTTSCNLSGLTAKAASIQCNHYDI